MGEVFDNSSEDRKGSTVSSTPEFSNCSSSRQIFNSKSNSGAISQRMLIEISFLKIGLQHFQDGQKSVLKKTLAGFQRRLALVGYIIQIRLLFSSSDPKTFFYFEQ